MPAVVDYGASEVQYRFAQLWRELAAGGVVRVIDKRTGRLRAWITPQPPPGITLVRVNVNHAIHRVGELFDAAALGGCTEVRDEVRHRSLYVHRVMPAALAPVARILPGVTARTSTGRQVEREVVPA